MLQPGRSGLRELRQLCVTLAGLRGGGCGGPHSLPAGPGNAEFLMGNTFSRLFAVFNFLVHAVEAEMKTNIILVALLALLTGVWAVPAGAQSTGTVKGSVKDQAGKPIADATVEFTNVDTGRKITLKTDKKGEYFSVGVNAGNYNAAVLQNGKMIDQLSHIPVAVGEEKLINFDLAKDQ